MNDLYSFDTSLEDAEITYAQMDSAYQNVFRDLHLDGNYHFRKILISTVFFAVLRVEADNGSMGGKKSHEWHIESEVGEDKIFQCELCQKWKNAELLQTNSAHSIGDESDSQTCKNCKECKMGNEKKAIEIGHSFLLGVKYSSAWNMLIQKPDHLNTKSPLTFVEMGCFGLGISRLLSTIIEKNSDSFGLKWAPKIAPWRVGIIPISSTHLDHATHLSSLLLQRFAMQNGEVVIENRFQQSPGYRMNDSRFLGIPWYFLFNAFSSRMDHD